MSPMFELNWDERDRRAACAALFQFANVSEDMIAIKLERGVRWVQKWWHRDHFADADREGTSLGKHLHGLLEHPLTSETLWI